MSATFEHSLTRVDGNSRGAAVPALDAGGAKRRWAGVRSACAAAVARVRASDGAPVCVVALSDGMGSVDVHVDTLRLVDGDDGWLTWLVDLETPTTGRHRVRFSICNGVGSDGERVHAAAVSSGRGEARLADRWGAFVGPALGDSIERAVGSRAGRLSRLRFTSDDGELSVLAASERGARG